MSWVEIKISDICTINSSYLTNRYHYDFIKYIDISSVGTGIIQAIKEIPKNTAPSRAKRIVNVGDTIISTVRPGRRSFFYFKSVEDNYVVSTGFAVLTPLQSRVDPRFLYYIISLQSFTDYLAANEQGAAYPAVTPEIIGNNSFLLPPLPTQKKIASILSAYDDLIENNLRRIKLLEEAAKNIYKEWFVNFRFPNYENTKFINGLPEGWERKTIDDVALISGGGTPSTKVSNYWENGNILWFTPTDLTKNDSIVILGSITKISEAGLSKSSAKLILNGSIMLTSRATIGYLAVIDTEYTTNQGFINITPNNAYSKSYLLLNFMDRKEEFINNAHGSTYKEITKGTFRKLEVVIPSEELLVEFDQQVSVIIKQLKILLKQNQSLKQARDLLLPRLLSGEIEV